MGIFPSLQPAFDHSDLLSVPIRLFPHCPVLLRALEIARKYNLTVYDTLYLALAEDHGAVIYSADRIMLKPATHLRLRDEIRTAR